MKEYPNGRDCKHGYLRGKCPHCESDELDKEVAELKRSLVEANAYIEKLKNTIVNLGFDGISILKERAKEGEEGWQ